MGRERMNVVEITKNGCLEALQCRGQARRRQREHFSCCKTTLLLGCVVYGRKGRVVTVQAGLFDSIGSSSSRGGGGGIEKKNLLVVGTKDGVGERGGMVPVKRSIVENLVVERFKERVSNMSDEELSAMIQDSVVSEFPLDVLRGPPELRDQKSAAEVGEASAAVEGRSGRREYKEKEREQEGEREEEEREQEGEKVDGSIEFQAPGRVGVEEDVNSSRTESDYSPSKGDDETAALLMGSRGGGGQPLSDNRGSVSTVSKEEDGIFVFGYDVSPKDIALPFMVVGLCVIVGSLIVGAMKSISTGDSPPPSSNSSSSAASVDAGSSSGDGGGMDRNSAGHKWYNDSNNLLGRFLTTIWGQNSKENSMEQVPGDGSITNDMTRVATDGRERVSTGDLYIEPGSKNDPYVAYDEGSAPAVIWQRQDDNLGKGSTLNGQQTFSESNRDEDPWRVPLRKKQSTMDSTGPSHNLDILDNAEQVIVSPRKPPKLTKFQKQKRM